jgi:glycosyltransferase involved in cell wall biosynthesis
MKVLHVISSVSARTGGPRMVIRDLTRFQARAGMHVTIFTTNIDYPHGNLDVPVNVPVKDHGVFRYHFAVQLITPLISFPMAAKLISSLRRYDVVHIHGLYRFPTTFTALLARAYGLPFIITPHGSLDPVIYYQSAVNLTAKRVYENLFEKQNLHKASAIHFASTKEMQQAGFLKLKAPGFVVPQGIDWSRFKNLPSRGYLRNRLDLDEEAAVILFLGRIHFIKGLDLLVRAFATVAGNIGHAVLVIAGPDNDGYVHTVKGWIESHGLASRVFYSRCWTETRWSKHMRTPIFSLCPPMLKASVWPPPKLWPAVFR